MEGDCTKYFREGAGDSFEETDCEYLHALPPLPEEDEM
jgi:hypothetical protein